MAGSEDLEYPRKILEYMDGYLVSKTLFTACELGVFDLLQQSTTPLSSDNIAKQLGTSDNGMDKLLSACVGLKLLNVKMENGKAFYSDTDLSRIYLTKSSPKTLYHSMQYLSDDHYLLVHYMADSVREGKPQREKAFGMKHGDIFDSVYRSDEEMLKFMNFMNSIWNVCGKDVVTAFDLSPFTNICDIGGSTGAIPKICISEYPEASVTIFDLPAALKMAKEHFISPKEQRIFFHGGDFFKDQIPEADLYIMARIMHDWTDDQCLELLKKIYKSCKPGGGVLLVEMVLNEDKSGPLHSLLGSLLMQVVTLGKERSPSEYNNLLTAAGFRDVQVKRTGKQYDAILGRK